MAQWRNALFDRDGPLLGLCQDDVDDDPPVASPPTSAPSQSPTFVPRDCSHRIGFGKCQDASGAEYDSCTKIVNPLRFSSGKCQKAAESVSNSVGWQYGVYGRFPVACVIFFDNVDSADDVTPLCPDGFGEFTVSSNRGTGFPQSADEGYLGCFSCEEE